jgi:hypothetical protein
MPGSVHSIPAEDRSMELTAGKLGTQSNGSKNMYFLYNRSLTTMRVSRKLGEFSMSCTCCSLLAVAYSNTVFLWLLPATIMGPRRLHTDKSKSKGCEPTTVICVFLVIIIVYLTVFFMASQINNSVNQLTN